MRRKPTILPYKIIRALNFEDGYYKLEVIEISLDSPRQVKVDLIFGNKKKSITLREGDTLESDPFYIIKLKLSSINQEIARITIEYPERLDKAGEI